MSTVPPGPRLRLRFEARLFQPHPHLANLGGELRPPGRAERGLGDDLHRVPAGRVVADHRPRLAQRLPLPKLGRPFGEVAGEGVERHGQRAALAGRPQPGVDFVQPAVRAELVAHADQPLAELAEEVAVDRAVVAASRSPECGGRPSFRRPLRTGR